MGGIVTGGRTPEVASVEGSKLVAAAADAAAGQQYPARALYVVATPIGNLADLTLRALHVLALVDAIACEDTRHSAALLRHFAIAKPLIAVHEHNERDAAGVVLARLARGERVAYVSDAGTPAVSDPGATLVAAAHRAGYRVVPVPGASSALAALCAAGDAGSSGFAFVGFLAARGTSGRRPLPRWRARRRPRSCSRRRTGSSRSRRRSPRRARSPTTLCRELTKQFETIATMPARATAVMADADPNRGRGEFVVVLHALAVTDAAATRRARHGARAPAGRAAAEAGGRARRRDLRRRRATCSMRARSR